MHPPDDVPQTPPYVSPFGRLRGLTDRVAVLSARLRRNDGGPFIGLGPIADLELVMRLLNLREYAEWLAVNGDDEQRRWAGEITRLQDEASDTEDMLADIERVVPVGAEQPYAEAVEAVAAKARQHDLTRAVLEQVGALVPGDTSADVPALIRALLS